MLHSRGRTAERHGIGHALRCRSLAAIKERLTPGDDALVVVTNDETLYIVAK